MKVSSLLLVTLLLTITIVSGGTVSTKNPSTRPEEVVAADLTETEDKKVEVSKVENKPKPQKDESKEHEKEDSKKPEKEKPENEDSKKPETAVEKPTYMGTWVCYKMLKK